MSREEGMRRQGPVTVVLAEDHAMVREGTRQMLEREQAIDVLGEAPDGPAAIELVRSLSPCVLLLDMGLPLSDGLEVTRAVRSLPAPPRVLILSAHDDAGYVDASLSAGASGYLLKTAAVREVVAAILAVANGELVLHRAVARQALSSAAAGCPAESLTGREIDVLRLLATGMRTREIAASLSLSTRTVESHFTSIFNKLGVDNRVEAVVRAAARGLVSIEPRA
jgi:DNA-binding NarL/FixJ family response regulator